MGIWKNHPDLSDLLHGLSLLPPEGCQLLLRSFHRPLLSGLLSVVLLYHLIAS